MLRIMNLIFKLMTGPTLILVFAVIICIETVFMVESFTTILEITVSLGGSAWNALMLVLLKTPEIVDFGLPIALLIGVYFTLTRIREEGAFVVCAAAGISWVRIPIFALIIGLLGGVISILISGFVAPQAQHIQRLAIFDMQANQIVNQLKNSSARRAVQEFAGTAFIATSPGAKEGGRGSGLLVHHKTDDGNWHISLADDWSVSGPDIGGNYVVQLHNFSDYVGNLKPYDLTYHEFGKRPAETAETAPLDVPGFSTLIVNNASMQFRLEEILGEKDEFRRWNELVLVDLITGASRGNHNSELRVLAEKTSRAILNPFAALIAILAAAAANSRLGRLTALPAGVIALLVMDVLGRVFMVWMSEFGQGAFVVAAGVIMVGSTLPLLALLSRSGEDIIHPFRDKTG
jgi:lipopolysaccharide export LptBFGC system permease protein LptF